MKLWKKVKLRDLLTRSKIPVCIEDTKIYTRVTIKTKHKGISKRDKEIGKKIGTKKQFLLKSGQFVMSKIDARYGAFGIADQSVHNAIITGNFWAYDINHELTTAEWIERYTNSFEFYNLCERASSGITHRKYLNENKFLSHDLHIPPKKEQENIILKLKKKQTTLNNLTTEITTQTTLLSQLRQAILQEAIEGKLTADWRKENPIRKGDPDFDAEALLKKIKIEKEKLIKEGKIKKQKPLAEIKAEEVPFGLPEGWVWTRLGEISQIFAGHSFNSYDFIFENGIKCIKITNAGVHQLIETKERLPSNFIIKYKDFLVRTNDLIIALTRPYISTGLKISRCPETFNNSLLNQRVAAIRNYFDLNWNYIYQFMTSNFVLNGYKDKFEKVNLQPNLKVSDITELYIPLPPLAEQQAIVDRVEKLLSMVDELEKQVSERKEQAEQLMQAVLREAFEPAAAGR